MRGGLHSARSQFQQGCTAATTAIEEAPLVANGFAPRVDTSVVARITSGGFEESFWYYGAGADGEVGAMPSDIQRLCSASAEPTYFAP